MWDEVGGQCKTVPDDYVGHMWVFVSSSVPSQILKLDLDHVVLHDRFQCGMKSEGSAKLFQMIMWDTCGCLFHHLFPGRY